MAPPVYSRYDRGVREQCKSVHWLVCKIQPDASCQEVYNLMTMILCVSAVFVQASLLVSQILLGSIAYSSLITCSSRAEAPKYHISFAR